MPYSPVTPLHIAAIGIGATLLMDGWSILRKRLLGMPSLDYALVGRWVGHMPRRRFRHAAIGKAEPITAERALGWLVHYLTGILFAVLLIGAAGRDWLCAPTLLPALVLGLATVLLPFLVMQPAFGLGIAAAKTAHPGKARIHSVLTHLIFGAGLYLAAQIGLLLPATCTN
ncbi:DUF2938 domain-containing protein [Pseudomonas multiresinivorans]|uniref:DUF2938 domain-containing protein n=1 Tax=Pseudomonas multiresinivorans TaxID=95301 RepID=A0A7Z3GQV8_9PSED|nr:DUF2938 domain-containing protein [Pseudomonas multiresinivorans]QJP09423.1 DUF2938 domain-containing protein [Pseudomonas multiresinivorans]